MVDQLINYYTILHLSSSNWYTQQLSLHQCPPLYFFPANRLKPNGLVGPRHNPRVLMREFVSKAMTHAEIKQFPKTTKRSDLSSLVLEGKLNPSEKYQRSCHIGASSPRNGVKMTFSLEPPPSRLCLCVTSHITVTNKCPFLKGHNGKNWILKPPPSQKLCFATIFLWLKLSSFGCVFWDLEI